MSNVRLAYSVREAAAVAGYSEHLIRKALREGVLKAYRPGGVGDYRILTDDLLAWIRGDGMPVKHRAAGPGVRASQHAA